MPRTLDGMDDDSLIGIFSFLSVPDILSLRQTSKRLLHVSKLHTVWSNACTSDVLQNRFPFPGMPLDYEQSADLERKTLRAYRLGRKWLSQAVQPRTTLDFAADNNTTISDVLFIPGHDGNRIMTVSKGIWSVITVWDISDGHSRKLCSWSPKGAIFNGIALASDPHSAATLAVLQTGYQSIELLALSVGTSEADSAFRQVCTLTSWHKPQTLQGDLLAVSDDSSEVVIWNWREQTCAVLHHVDQLSVGLWRYDRCIQVVFARDSILVARARSLHLFPMPVLRPKEDRLAYRPLASHSFGWTDGISISVSRTIDRSRHESSPNYGDIHLLVRMESDDPWAAGNHTLDLYNLKLNPGYTADPDVSTDRDAPEAQSPYIFPPRLVAQAPSVRGSLRCTDIALGVQGTAVWLHPHDRSVTGLVSSEDHLQSIPAAELPSASESVVGTVLPGGLLPDKESVQARPLWNNSRNDWTSLAYNEELGRIALGSSSGRVTVVEL